MPGSRTQPHAAVRDPEFGETLVCFYQNLNHQRLRLQVLSGEDPIGEVSFDLGEVVASGLLQGSFALAGTQGCEVSVVTAMWQNGKMAKFALTCLFPLLGRNPRWRLP